MTSYILTKPMPTTNVNLQTLLQVVGASIFIALCAHITIPLFFTPTPLSMVTLSIMLVGGVLGSKRGLASMLLFLGMGSLGLPVYYNYTFAMTALVGYKIGHVVLAYLTGWYVENYPKSSIPKTVCALVFFCFIQMSFGVLVLGNFVGWNQVLLMGFYPFIPGEILKSVIAAKYLASKK